MRHGADAELQQVTVVAKKLVLEQDLIDHFLRTSHGQCTSRLTHGFELRPGGGRPAAFATDLGHHLGVGWEEFIRRLLGLVGNIGERVDSDLEACGVMAGPAGRFAVERHKGAKRSG